MVWRAIAAARLEQRWGMRRRAKGAMLWPTADVGGWRWACGRVDGWACRLVLELSRCSSGAMFDRPASGTRSACRGQARAPEGEGAIIPVPIMATQMSSHLARAATSSTLHETDICQPPAPKASLSHTRADRTRAGLEEDVLSG